MTNVVSDALLMSLFANWTPNNCDVCDEMATLLETASSHFIENTDLPKTWDDEAVSLKLLSVVGTIALKSPRWIDFYSKILIGVYKNADAYDDLLELTELTAVITEIGIKVPEYLIANSWEFIYLHGLDLIENHHDYFAVRVGAISTVDEVAKILKQEYDTDVRVRGAMVCAVPRLDREPTNKTEEICRRSALIKAMLA